MGLIDGESGWATLLPTLQAEDPLDVEQLARLQAASQVLAKQLTGTFIRSKQAKWAGMVAKFANEFVVEADASATIYPPTLASFLQTSFHSPSHDVASGIAALSLAVMLMVETNNGVRLRFRLLHEDIDLEQALGLKIVDAIVDEALDFEVVILADTRVLLAFEADIQLEGLQIPLGFSVKIASVTHSQPLSLFLPIAATKNLSASLSCEIVADFHSGFPYITEGGDALIAENDDVLVTE